MFTVISCMFMGVAAGWLMRNHDCGWSSKAVILIIWVLLFFLGVEVGGNKRIMTSLPELGMDALTIAVLSMAGSSIFAWLLWKYISNRKR